MFKPSPKPQTVQRLNNPSSQPTTQQIDSSRDIMSLVQPQAQTQVISQQQKMGIDPRINQMKALAEKIKQRKKPSPIQDLINRTKAIRG